MLLLMFVNAVWCEAAYLMDVREVGMEYYACLKEQSTWEALSDCYAGYIASVGDALTQLANCVYM